MDFRFTGNNGNLVGKALDTRYKQKEEDDDDEEEGEADK